MATAGRSNDVIRMGLLAKLSREKIWARERPKSHQTCIVFDWDDTILCTSYLVQFPALLELNKAIPAHFVEALDQLDQAGVTVLKAAKANGITYIITNAAEGWVEASAEKFLPRVFAELQSNVTIISARSKYEDLYPDDFQQWKLEAFMEARAVLDDDALTNIVAIGDNDVEIEAAYNLAT